MNILLERDIKTPDMTQGKLTFGDTMLYTCEDAIREVKIDGITCIPFGEYKVIISFSNRFQKPLPLLLDVPGFSGIRIHSGNTPADTEGCILVGTARNKTGVVNSRLALGILMDTMESAIESGEDVRITIS